jgi:hypothetical protein
MECWVGGAPIAPLHHSITRFFVMPVKTGIQVRLALQYLDSGMRRNDGIARGFSPSYAIIRI